jgi:hypothetical protein
MTPKEKARELVLKYLRIENTSMEWFNTHIAKQCALIAVDEMLLLRYLLKKETWFYKEVKKEIEKL